MNTMQVPEFPVSQAERGATATEPQELTLDQYHLIESRFDILLAAAVATAIVALTSPGPRHVRFP